MSDTETRNDEAQQQGEARQQDAAAASGRQIGARQAVEKAVTYLTEMTGQEPEVVIGVEPDDGHWHVQLELLELSRIPSTTDVLGCYEVDLNEEGEPESYHRTRRYHRGSVGEY